MADEFTPNLGLTKPDVGASDDTWGEKLNTNFDLLDAALAGGGGGGPIPPEYITDAELTVILDGYISDGELATILTGYVTQAEFPEKVDDRVAALLVPGANITITYDDVGNTLTIAGAAAGGGGTGDVTGPASSVNNRIAVFNGTTGKVIKDGGNLIADFALVSHTHTAAQITDFAEATDDRVNALLQAGSNITLTYNDVGNTLTIAAASGPAPPDPATAVPIVESGTGAVGTSLKYAREDHVHPLGPGGGGGTSVVISDTAPVGQPAGTFWWESDSGSLYINYNDGTSTQWVLVGLPNSNTKMGVTDGSAPATGEIGEVVEASGSTSGLVTGVPQSPVSMIIPPGDWNLWASHRGSGSGSTVITDYFVSLHTATGSPVHTAFQTFRQRGVSATDPIIMGAVGPVRILTSVNVTWYFNVYCAFTGTAPQIDSTMRRERRR